jgi:hypothetical protein
MTRRSGSNAHSKASSITINRGVSAGIEAIPILRSVLASTKFSSEFKGEKSWQVILQGKT